EQLKKKEIGYAVIAPRVTEVKEKDWDKYYKLMRGDIDVSFKELVEGSKLALPSFMGMGWFKRLVIGWAIGNIVNNKGLDVDGLESYLKQWRDKELVLNRFGNTLELNTRGKRIAVKLENGQPRVINENELLNVVLEQINSVQRPNWLNEGIEATIAGFKEEQKMDSPVLKADLERWIEEIGINNVFAEERNGELFIYNKLVRDRKRAQVSEGKKEILKNLKFYLGKDEKNNSKQDIERTEKDEETEEYKNFLTLRDKWYEERDKSPEAKESKQTNKGILDFAKGTLNKIGGFFTSEETKKESSPRIGKLAIVERISNDKSKAQIRDSKGTPHILTLNSVGFDINLLKRQIKQMEGIDSNYKQILLEMLSLLEHSPPEFRVFNTLVDDLFGFASADKNLIALHQTLINDPIALFHEIVEYLVKEELIAIKEINNKLIIKGEREDYGVIILQGNALDFLQNRSSTDHNKIRALQRQVFGVSDQVLSDKINKSKKTNIFSSVAREFINIVHKLTPEGIFKDSDLGEERRSESIKFTEEDKEEIVKKYISKLSELFGAKRRSSYNLLEEKWQFEKEPEFVNINIEQEKERTGLDGEQISILEEHCAGILSPYEVINNAEIEKFENGYILGHDVLIYRAFSLILGMLRWTWLYDEWYGNREKHTEDFMSSITGYGNRNPDNKPVVVFLPRKIADYPDGSGLKEELDWLLRNPHNLENVYIVLGAYNILKEDPVNYYGYFELKGVGILDYEMEIIEPLAQRLEKYENYITEGEEEISVKRNIFSIGKKIHEINIKEDNTEARIIDINSNENYLTLTSEEPLNIGNLKKQIKQMKGIDSNYKQILLEMLSLLEHSPPEFRVFNTLIEDLFGFASAGKNLIALHKAIKDDPIALFHEISEYLVKNNKIKFEVEYEEKDESYLPFNFLRKDRGDSISSIVIRDENNDEIGRIELKDINAEEERMLTLAQQQGMNHYRIRLFQKKVFGKSDRRLTEEIRHNQIGLVKDPVFETINIDEELVKEAEEGKLEQGGVGLSEGQVEIIKKYSAGVMSIYDYLEKAEENKFELGYALGPSNIGAESNYIYEALSRIGRLKEWRELYAEKFQSLEEQTDEIMDFLTYNPKKGEEKSPVVFFLPPNVFGYGEGKTVTAEELNWLFERTGRMKNVYFVVGAYNSLQENIREYLGKERGREVEIERVVKLFQNHRRYRKDSERTEVAYEQGRDENKIMQQAIKEGKGKIVQGFTGGIFDSLSRWKRGTKEEIQKLRESLEEVNEREIELPENLGKVKVKENLEKADIILLEMDEEVSFDADTRESGSKIYINKKVFDSLSTSELSGLLVRLSIELEAKQKVEYHTLRTWDEEISAKISEFAARVENSLRNNKYIGKLAQIVSINKNKTEVEIRDSRDKIHTVGLRSVSLDISLLKRQIEKMEGIDSNYKQILLEMLSLLEHSPPEFRVFNTLVDDLFGFTSKDENIIALHQALINDPVALFHEIGEYLINSGQISIKLGDSKIAFINNLKNKQIGKDIFLKGDALSIYQKDSSDPHYVLRALQRQTFGNVDRMLTQKIKAYSINQQLKTALETLSKDPDNEQVKREIQQIAKKNPSIYLQQYLSLIRENKEYVNDYLLEEILSYLNNKDENIRKFAFANIYEILETKKDKKEEIDLDTYLSRKDVNTVHEVLLEIAENEGVDKLSMPVLQEIIRAYSVDSARFVSEQFKQIFGSTPNQDLLNRWIRRIIENGLSRKQVVRELIGNKDLYEKDIEDIARGVSEISPEKENWNDWLQEASQGTGKSIEEVQDAINNYKDEAEKRQKKISYKMLQQFSNSVSYVRDSRIGRITASVIPVGLMILYLSSMFTGTGIMQPVTADLVEEDATVPEDFSEEQIISLPELQEEPVTQLEVPLSGPVAEISEGDMEYDGEFKVSIISVPGMEGADYKIHVWEQGEDSSNAEIIDIVDTKEINLEKEGKYNIQIVAEKDGNVYKGEIKEIEKVFDERVDIPEIDMDQPVSGEGFIEMDTQSGFARINLDTDKEVDYIRVWQANNPDFKDATISDIKIAEDDRGNPTVELKDLNQDTYVKLVSYDTGKMPSEESNIIHIDVNLGEQYEEPNIVDIDDSRAITGDITVKLRPGEQPNLVEDIKRTSYENLNQEEKEWINSYYRDRVVDYIEVTPNKKTGETTVVIVENGKLTSFKAYDALYEEYRGEYREEIVNQLEESKLKWKVSYTDYEVEGRKVVDVTKVERAGEVDKANYPQVFEVQVVGKEGNTIATSYPQTNYKETIDAEFEDLPYGEYKIFVRALGSSYQTSDDRPPSDWIDAGEITIEMPSTERFKPSAPEMEIEESGKGYAKLSWSAPAGAKGVLLARGDSADDFSHPLNPDEQKNIEYYFIPDEFSSAVVDKEGVWRVATVYETPKKLTTGEKGLTYSQWSSYSEEDNLYQEKDIEEKFSLSAILDTIPETTGIFIEDNQAKMFYKESGDLASIIEYELNENNFDIVQQKETSLDKDETVTKWFVNGEIIKEQRGSEIYHYNVDVEDVREVLDSTDLRASVKNNIINNLSYSPTLEEINQILQENNVIDSKQRQGIMNDILDKRLLAQDGNPFWSSVTLEDRELKHAIPVFSISEEDATQILNEQRIPSWTKQSILDSLDSTVDVNKLEQTLEQEGIEEEAINNIVGELSTFSANKEKAQDIIKDNIKDREARDRVLKSIDFQVKTKSFEQAIRENLSQQEADKIIDNISSDLKQAQFITAKSETNEVTEVVENYQYFDGDWYLVSKEIPGAEQAFNYEYENFNGRILLVYDNENGIEKNYSYEFYPAEKQIKAQKVTKTDWPGGPEQEVWQFNEQEVQNIKTRTISYESERPDVVENYDEEEDISYVINSDRTVTIYDKKINRPKVIISEETGEVIQEIEYKSNNRNEVVKIINHFLLNKQKEEIDIDPATGFGIAGRILSEEGEVISTWEDDGEIKISKNMFTGETEKTYHDYPYGPPSRGEVSSEDGTIISTWEDDGQVKTVEYKLTDETEKMYYAYSYGPLERGEIFNSKGTLISTWEDDGKVKTIENQITGEKEREFHAYNYGPTTEGETFAQDGTLINTWEDDGIVKTVENKLTGEIEKMYHAYSYGPFERGEVFSTEGELIKTWEDDGYVRTVKNVLTGMEEKMYREHLYGPITRGEFVDPQGEIISSWEDDGQVRTVVDKITGQTEKMYHAYAYGPLVRGEIYAADGKLISSWMDDGEVRTVSYEFTDETEKMYHKYPYGPLYKGERIDRDGTLISTWEDSSNVKTIVNELTGETEKMYHVYPDGPLTKGEIFAGDGTLVSTWEDNGEVKTVVDNFTGDIQKIYHSYPFGPFVSGESLDENNDKVSIWTEKDEYGNWLIEKQGKYKGFRYRLINLPHGEEERIYYLPGDIEVARERIASDGETIKFIITKREKDGSVLINERDFEQTKLTDEKNKRYEVTEFGDGRKSITIYEDGAPALSNIMLAEDGKTVLWSQENYKEDGSWHQKISTFANGDLTKEVINTLSFYNGHVEQGKIIEYYSDGKKIYNVEYEYGENFNSIHLIYKSNGEIEKEEWNERINGVWRLTERQNSDGTGIKTYFNEQGRKDFQYITYIEKGNLKYVVEEFTYEEDRIIGKVFELKDGERDKNIEDREKIKQISENVYDNLIKEWQLNSGWKLIEGDKYTFEIKTQSDGSRVQFNYLTGKPLGVMDGLESIDIFSHDITYKVKRIDLRYDEVEEFRILKDGTIIGEVYQLKDIDIDFDTGIVNAEKEKKSWFWIYEFDEVRAYNENFEKYRSWDVKPHHLIGAIPIIGYLVWRRNQKKTIAEYQKIIDAYPEEDKIKEKELSELIENLKTDSEKVEKDVQEEWNKKIIQKISEIIQNHYNNEINDITEDGITVLGDEEAPYGEVPVEGQHKKMVAMKMAEELLVIAHTIEERLGVPELEQYCYDQQQKLNKIIDDIYEQERVPVDKKEEGTTEEKETRKPEVTEQEIKELNDQIYNIKHSIHKQLIEESKRRLKEQEFAKDDTITQNRIKELKNEISSLSEEIKKLENEIEEKSKDIESKNKKEKEKIKEEIGKLKKQISDLKKKRKKTDYQKDWLEKPGEIINVVSQMLSDYVEDESIIPPGYQETENYKRYKKMVTSIRLSLTSAFVTIGLLHPLLAVIAAPLMYKILWPPAHMIGYTFTAPKKINGHSKLNYYQLKKYFEEYKKRTGQKYRVMYEVVTMGTEKNVVDDTVSYIKKNIHEMKSFTDYFGDDCQIIYTWVSGAMAMPEEKEEVIKLQKYADDVLGEGKVIFLYVQGKQKGWAKKVGDMMVVENLIANGYTTAHNYKDKIKFESTRPEGSVIFDAWGDFKTALNIKETKNGEELRNNEDIIQAMKEGIDLQVDKDAIPEIAIGLDNKNTVPSGELEKALGIMLDKKNRRIKMLTPNIFMTEPEKHGEKLSSYLFNILKEARLINIKDESMKKAGLFNYGSPYFGKGAFRLKEHVKMFEYEILNPDYLTSHDWQESMFTWAEVATGANNVKLENKKVTNQGKRELWMKIVVGDKIDICKLSLEGEDYLLQRYDHEKGIFTEDRKITTDKNASIEEREEQVVNQILSLFKNDFNIGERDFLSFKAILLRDIRWVSGDRGMEKTAEPYKKILFPAAQLHLTGLQIRLYVNFFFGAFIGITLLPALIMGFVPGLIYNPAGTVTQILMGGVFLTAMAGIVGVSKFSAPFVSGIKEFKEQGKEVDKKGKAKLGAKVVGKAVWDISITTATFLMLIIMFNVIVYEAI
ncbi:MAG: hypothetical protein ACOC5T_00825, partial [Elusimicrobiota bacterium]